MPRLGFDVLAKSFLRTHMADEHFAAMVGTGRGDRKRRYGQTGAQADVFREV